MLQGLVFEPDLRRELEALDIQEFSPLTIILKEGSYIKGIPLVLEGSIKVRKLEPGGKEITLYRITNGESCILSITSCLNSKPSNAQAVVEYDTRMIVIPSDKVRDWMEKYTSWRKFVMGLFYDRLEQVLALVDAIAFQQVDSRLISKLRQLQVMHGDSIKLTHQDLANEIGTAREVVSRLLKNLESEGKLRLDRGKIEIISLV